MMLYALRPTAGAAHAPAAAARAAPPSPVVPAPAATGWIAFLAHFLFVLAAWTITIKYLFPIAFAAAHGEALMSYVYWDLWPVAHLWLGWALLRRPWYTRALAVTMAVIEIAIIVTVFAVFFADPEWTIWRTNWFINKLFVLTCFVLVLGTFTFIRPGPPAGMSRSSASTQSTDSEGRT